MRLLKRGLQGEVSLTKDLTENIPVYGILSHTWGQEEDEVTFEDLEKGNASQKARGYAKLQFCGIQAEKDGLQYFWVDTCCINKANHAELSEAITSMFRWYQNAAKCYVYLSDVSATSNCNDQSERKWQAAFCESRWFRRGWTLQELLAPASVDFFSREGMHLGSKKTLEALIHKITKIPIAALQGQAMSRFSIEERLAWAAGRSTTRPEDEAYCLLGIFNVFMPLIYGERENAFRRLKEEIRKQSYGASALHGDAVDEVERELREHILMDLDRSERRWRYHQIDTAHEGTFEWLYENSCGFVNWLSHVGVETSPVFWITGKPGSGKSTLMKWIVQQEKTAQYLQSSGSGQWELIPFFFYDQGSNLQNTIEGLLQELLWKLLRLDVQSVDIISPILAADLLGDSKTILYAIQTRQHPDSRFQWMFQRSDIFARLAKLKLRTNEAKVRAGDETYQDVFAHRSWSLDALKASIFALLQHSGAKGNFCIFVDALDENHGSHRNLTEFLRSIASLEVSSKVHVKLCLSSRPEPHFVNNFITHPGFAIHEYTFSDIQRFVEDQLMSAVGNSTDSHTSANILTLVQEITAKANGIFIWSRLVVAELCDALEDGCTLSQLRLVLETTPSDLFELYKRILLKIKPQYRYEAYVMFQICLHSQFHSTCLFEMILDHVLGSASLIESDERPTTQFINRIQSRTGGLLQIERAKTTKHGEIPPQVIFLHRTVKSFLEGNQCALLNFEELPLHEHGLVYLFKFGIFAMQNLELDQLERYESMLRDLVSLYSRAEQIIGPAADDILEQLLRPSVASNEIKDLIFRSFGEDLSVESECSSHSEDPLSGRISDRILEGFYAGADRKSLPLLRNATLDGLHILDSLNDVGSNVRRLVVNSMDSTDTAAQYFTTALSNRPLALLLEACTRDWLPYVQRKLHSHHYTTPKGFPSILYTVLYFSHSVLFKLTFDEVSGHRIKRQEAGCLMWISQFKDIISMALKIEPRVTVHMPTEKSALAVFLNNKSVFPYSDLGHRSVLDICSFLIKSGFPCTDALRNYPLGSRMSKGKNILLELLLEHGADVNYEDRLGRRPLFKAIELALDDDAAMLLSYGADPLNIGGGISAICPERRIWTVQLGPYLNKEDFIRKAHKMQGLFEKYTL